MRSYFVTGTGTEVGKTYVTAGVIRAARQAGRVAIGVKPVLSGYNAAAPAESDAGAILAAMGKPVTARSVAAIAPWRYRAAISPDMAAALEGRSISLAAVLTFCRAAVEATPGMTLVEGVGGAMVPIDPWHTVRDWIAALRMPAILVAGTYLGTISHVLTAVDALAARNVEIAGIVLSESETSPVPPEATARAIARFLPRTQIFTIPRGRSEMAFQRLAWALDQYGVANAL
jgi:dethiobiotin synthetase